MNSSYSSLSTADSSPAPGLTVLDDPHEYGRFTRWVSDTDGVRLGESAFQLGGMYCAACADLIEAALIAVPGVREAQVSSAAQRARVQWDPTLTRPSALVEAVRHAGYDAVPDAAASARELRRRERRKALWRVFVASFAAMQVMMFATPSYVADTADFTDDLRQLLNWGSWLVSMPVLVFSAGPFFSGAWRSLRTRRISMDVPVAVGLIVTFVTSMGATFDPTGPFGHEVYFDSFTMFVSFLLTGRFLEMSARHRAAESLESVLAAMPEVAERIGADGRIEVVSVARLREGDRVQVAMGAAFPADGVLESSGTEANESLLTGESRPVLKRKGDALVGGSINVGAPCRMQIVRVGKDTRYESIVSLMRDALTSRPALASKADAWAGPFLWAVLVLAAGAAVAWSMIDPSRAVWVAVAVLIVTCPCALSLAVPSALVSAAGAMARRGIMLQRLDAIEALAAMDWLFIDKTGTLTESCPMLVEVRPLSTDAFADSDLPAVRTLASWSGHPLAQALAGRDQGTPSPSGSELWKDIQETPGAGLEAIDTLGRRCRLGSLEWVSGRAGAQLPASASQLAGEDDRATVYFGRDSTPVAVFRFEEHLRPDAAEATRELMRSGLKVSLLSGDSSRRSARIGHELGLTDVRSGAQPEEKLAAIADVQQRGHVVGMVGDGVNDAPVLARANVSFAMGQGALVSRVHADAVIMSNRLLDLVWARQLARRSLIVVRQNLIWAAVYNAACIPLALAGYLPPWAAGLGMALSSLLVVGNSMRLSR